MKRLIKILAILFGLIILPSASAFAAQIVANPASDYVHLTGNVRFRNSGMLLKSSNFPAGGGMTP